MPNQHQALHNTRPGDCCLCDRETRIAELEKEVRELKASLVRDRDPVSGVFPDRLVTTSPYPPPPGVVRTSGTGDFPEWAPSVTIF